MGGMGDQIGAGSEQSDTALLRTAWWSLNRGVETLQAKGDRFDASAIATITEMRQTMETIHAVLESRS